MSIYIKRDTLAIMLDTLQKKGDNGINITISANDRNDNYGHNVAAFVSQSKDDRDAGKPRYYVGNGSVFYVSDDGVKVLPKEQPRQEQTSGEVTSTEQFPF